MAPRLLRGDLSAEDQQAKCRGETGGLRGVAFEFNLEYQARSQEESLAAIRVSPSPEMIFNNPSRGRAPPFMARRLADGSRFIEMTGRSGAAISRDEGRSRERRRRRDVTRTRAPRRPDFLPFPTGISGHDRYARPQRALWSSLPGFLGCSTRDQSGGEFFSCRRRGSDGRHTDRQRCRAVCLPGPRFFFSGN